MNKVDIKSKKTGLFASAALLVAAVIGGTIFSQANRAEAAPTPILSTNLSSWYTGDTKGTGQNIIVPGGVNVKMTDGVSKASGYYSVTPYSLVDEVTAGTTTSSAIIFAAGGTGTIPSAQIGVDLDGNGTLDGYIVGESAHYGPNWWLSSWLAPHNIKTGDAAACATATKSPLEIRSGYCNTGTLADFATAFPNAKVVAIGWSMGTGPAAGDWIITGLNFANHTFTFDKDSVKPKMSVTFPSNGAIISSTSAKFQAEVEDNIGLQKVGFNIYANATCTLPVYKNGVGGAVSGLKDTYSEDISSLIPDEGEYCIKSSVIDASGNTFWPAAVSFTIDNTAPTLVAYDRMNAQKQVIADGAIVNPDFLANSTVYIYITETNPDKLTINGVELPKASGKSGFVDIGNKLTADGVYVIKAIDIAGNESAAYTITIDRTAPTATITYNPNTWTNGSVTATITTNEVIKTLAGWTKVSDTEYTKVYTTNTTEQVEIEDLAGNKSTVDVIVTNIDKVKPTINVLSPIDGSVVKSENAKVEIEATDNVGLKSVTANLYANANCSLPVFKNLSGTVSGLNATHTYDMSTLNLAEGDYCLKTAVTDVASNVIYGTPVKFTIDNTAPTMRFVDGDNIEIPNNSTVNPSKLAKGILRGQIVETHNFKVYLNGNEHKNYENGRSFQLGWLPEGTHTFKIVDEAGNESIIYTITIDKTAPATIVVTPTEGQILQSKNLQVRVESTDNQSLTKIVANLYNEAGTLLKSSFSTVSGQNAFHEYDFSSLNLADGNYYIKANALDAANNISNTVVRNFTIDNTNPTITVISPIDGSIIKSEDAKLEIEVGDNIGLKNVTAHLYASADCSQPIAHKLNGDVSGLSAIHTYDMSVLNLAEGEYCLATAVTDIAGNTTWPARVKFTIDNTAPTATITYNPNTWTNGSVTATITTNEVIKTLAGWTKVSDTEYTKVYTTNTTEQVEIEDLAGNKSTVDVIVTNIDKVKPTININSVSLSADHKTLDFDIEIVDNESGLAASKCALYDSADKKGNRVIDNIDCLNITSVDISALASGTYYLHVWAKDIAGNQIGDNNNPVASVALDVDHTAPQVVSVTYSPDTTTEGSVTVTIVFDEEVQDIAGWTRIDAVSFKKTFTANTSEDVNFTDLVGNDGTKETVTITWITQPQNNNQNQGSTGTGSSSSQQNEEVLGEKTDEDEDGDINGATDNTDINKIAGASDEKDDEESWALLNLLAVIATVGIAVGTMVVRRVTDKATVYRVIAAGVAIASIIAFIIIDDISLPMTFANNWSILMVLLALVNTGLLVGLIRSDKQD